MLLSTLSPAEICQRKHNFQQHRRGVREKARRDTKVSWYDPFSKVQHSSNQPTTSILFPFLLITKLPFSFLPFPPICRTGKEREIFCIFIVPKVTFSPRSARGFIESHFDNNIVLCQMPKKRFPFLNIFLCSAFAGDSVVLWKKGERVISAGDVKVRKDARMTLVEAASLRITGVDVADTGNYTCEVEWGAGEAPKQIVHHLQVQVPPQIEAVLPAGGLLGQVDRPIEAREGSSVNLECRADGIPTPVIRWRRPVKRKSHEKQRRGFLKKGYWPLFFLNWCCCLQREREAF